MKILILGGAGMMGHKLWQTLPNHASGQFDVYLTLRQGLEKYQRFALFDPARTIEGVSIEHFDSVVQAINKVQPQVVINCIGIVKQREEAKAAVPSILVNALLPHQLADLCQARGSRLIHLSTDCVFSGHRGRYTEQDNPDPVDLYGRTKLVGEVNRPGCLTLRTSIIGWELEHRAGLLEWFAAQRGRTIKGYRGAIYTGLSTAALTQLIAFLLEEQPDLSGLYQVASQPITKYELLVRLREALGWHDITIQPDDDFQCDRSLIGAAFEAATGWHTPEWDEMIAGLAAEWLAYERWRKAG